MDSDFKPRKRQVKSAAPDEPQLTPTQTTAPETFHTPDQTAAADDLLPVDASVLAANDATEPDTIPSKSAASSLKTKLALHWPPRRKEGIVAVVVGILIIGSGVAIAATQHSGAKPVATVKTIKPVAKVAPKPMTVASTLSGLAVDPTVNQRPVTGVMIENSVQARPQSGLSQASVVFEAIAEGGITRFLALFQDTSPENVGPIRSARPYYAQWALGFDAGYAHVGGSPEALANIKAWGVRDLDQFYNGGSYHRITTREAPHNVYTAIETLNQLETAKGYTTSKFTGFARKPEAASKQPNAKSINLNISGPIYNVHYDYNTATNSYNRNEGGTPHIDANTNTQISPKVVVALVLPYSLGSDGYHSVYNTLGSGVAYIFQDGVVTTGNWNKADNATQFTFTDAKGASLKLNPGQTWLTAVSSTTNVSYTP